jgi:threonine/homoserine/homoserine lactone efflux protein
MSHVLALSFVLGFVTASPLGPIGLLCLRRTLSRGMITGLISASGIACAYAFWSYVAIHGLATISQWIDHEKTLLQVVIGLFFLLYGLHGLVTVPSPYDSSSQRRGGIAEFFSTFLVVFLNPSTFIMFSALFTLAGITQQHFGFYESLEIASAVFGGSLVFWIALAYIIQYTKGAMNDALYQAISRVASSAIMIFGLAILVYSLSDYVIWHGLG